MSKIALQLILGAKEKKLKSLNLGNCSLKENNIPEELYELEWLEELILSNSYYDFLTDKVESNNNLGENNTFHFLPLNLSKLINLKKLVISGTAENKWHIRSLHPLMELNNLVTLYCSNNEIRDLSSLQYLDLENLFCYDNAIEDVRVLRKFRALRRLDIGSNQISDISSIEEIKYLEYLNCSNNNIFDISPVMKIPKLVELDCSRNKLHLSLELMDMPKLESIDCSANQIESFSLSGLPNLKKVKCANTLIWSLKTLSNLKTLEELDCHSNYHLKNLSSLKDLPLLRDLNISDHKLNHLAAVEDLSQLKVLNIANCNLYNLHVLKKLKELEALDISDNYNIKDITVLAHFSKLHTFYCSNNNINDLTPLSNLKKLVYLRCAKNKIEDISFISKLKDLKLFDCRDNNITDLTPLKETIINNQTILSTEIEYPYFGKDKLILILNANPLETPPIEICEQGTSSIIDWFKAIKTKLKEIKIIIIGDAKAGKTSLLRKIKDDVFFPNEVQTDGVNIEDIEFRSCYYFKDNIELHSLTGHFWDFGGQEIMNATHQFFLTNRSIYILVLDARKDQNVSMQIRHWMKRIMTTSGESPIIVVANQIDINSGFGFENEYELKLEFPQIKYFIKTSCATNEQIEFLRTKLAEVIPMAELFNTEIDIRWSEIMEQLQIETKSLHFIDEDRFVNICTAFNLLEKSARSNLIHFLHDLGLVLHFEFLALSEYYVLDPYWITYGVYQILTSNFAGSRKGIIEMNMLEYIVNEEEDKKEIYRPSNYIKLKYSNNQRRYLVDIMNHFKLCFYTPDHNSFIIPDLLHTIQPIEKTERIRYSNNNIQFIYEYDYLPKSTLPHIMVELHKLIISIWRTGCILLYRRCEALISSYQNRLTIYVVGEHKEKREFMAVIRHVIDKINVELKYLPKMLIPLPNISEYAEYEVLLNREKKNLIYYIHDEDKVSETKFEISKLLEGIPTYDEVGGVNDIIKRIGNLDKKIDSKIEYLIQRSDLLIELSKTFYKDVELKYRLAENEIIYAIQELSTELLNAITLEMSDMLNRIFVEFDAEIDAKLKNLFLELKDTDNLEMKMKISLPILNLLGMELGVQFDLKKWILDMYSKHGSRIFILMEKIML